MATPKRKPARPRDPQPDDGSPPEDNPFEEWERYPAHEAEENIGYQKLAWYGGAFADAGIALVVLGVVVNLLRRAGRTVIRLLMR